MLAAIAGVLHLYPFRTQKLRPPAIQVVLPDGGNLGTLPLLIFAVLTTASR